jgi:hypothetical protein
MRGVALGDRFGREQPPTTNMFLPLGYVPTFPCETLQGVRVINRPDQWSEAHRTVGTECMSRIVVGNDHLDPKAHLAPISWWFKRTSIARHTPSGSCRRSSLRHSQQSSAAHCCAPGAYSAAFSPAMKQEAGSAVTELPCTHHKARQSLTYCQEQRRGELGPHVMVWWAPDSGILPQGL